MSLISALLFPVPPVSYTMHSFPSELLWIPSEMDYDACKPGDCIPAVFLQCPNARYLILYLHSNGEDIGLCYPFGCGLRLVLEVHVLLVEYPGYGLCPGESSEETLSKAADAAFRFVCEVLRWPAQDVIVMGRSLGAALATRLARKHQCHGLILVAPFLSLIDAVGQYVGATLAKAFVGNIFCNREHMAGVEVPTMVVHGQRDRLVPCDQGRLLFDLCPHERKLLVTPEEMGHNCDLLGNPEFLIRPMLRFFSLPDYNFDELVVPPEAFDKRLCLQYHHLVELMKGEMPMRRLSGDQDSCPSSGHCDTPAGPQRQVQYFMGSNGDMDDMSGSLEVTVCPALCPVALAPMAPFGTIVTLEPTGDEPGVEHVGTPAEGSRAGSGGPDGRHSMATTAWRAPQAQSSPTEAGSPAQGTAAVAAVPEAARAESLDSASTAAASSQPTKPSESLSGEAPGEDSPGQCLPGLRLLDLDRGITRYLHESGTISTI
mmetsp:Transcript_81362/g.225277  ORF Transcript_81362/g.225277 Transcript_81362/m.225277 type:complete len:487 (+) Transcript_81362:111-1571(+)